MRGIRRRFANECRANPHEDFRATISAGGVLGRTKRPFVKHERASGQLRPIGAWRQQTIKNPGRPGPFKDVGYGGRNWASAQRCLARHAGLWCMQLSVHSLSYAPACSGLVQRDRSAPAWCMPSHSFRWWPSNWPHRCGRAA